MNGPCVIRVRLTITGVPDGFETIAVVPAGAGSVFDAAGNPMAGTQTTGAIAMIPSAITIVSRETQDSNGDGFIDQIKITTLPSQSLNDDFSGLKISVAGYTVIGYSTGTPNDNVFYVNLAKGTSFDTGATPLVRVEASDANLQASDGHTIVKETTGVAATDSAPPVVAVTLAAVSGTRIYVRFSEPVYTDAAHTAPVQAADITYAPSTGLVLIGPSAAFLTVPAMTAQTVTTDTFSIGANAIYDAVGLAMSATTRPVSELMLGVVVSVFAHDGIHTDVPASQSGAIRVFDGTGRLLDRDITLEARFATARWPTPLDLIFDASVPASRKPNGFWLPTGIDGLAPADTDAHSLSARGVAQLRDFVIPASDSKVENGNTIEFLFSADFGSGTRYCLRVLDPDDPRTVRPYAFKVSDVARQRGGVTILANVINPNAGDKTRLMYSLPKGGRVTILVFSLGGDIVNVLYSGYQTAGDYSVTWDGRNRGGREVARSVSFIKIVAPGMEEVRKVLVVK